MVFAKSPARRKTAGKTTCALKESDMDKNTPAYWSLSLDTECPKCGHNFDLLCDPDFWEVSGAKQACEEIKGYEACCPECNHEFKTDFVY